MSVSPVKRLILQVGTPDRGEYTTDFNGNSRDKKLKNGNKKSRPEAGLAPL